MAEHNMEQELTDSIRHLRSAISSTQLYDRSHPMVESKVQAAHEALVTALRAVPEVTIVVLGEDIVVNNRPIRRGGSAVEGFGRMLTDKGVERVTLRTGLRREEIEGLIDGLIDSGGNPLRSSRCLKLGKVDRSETPAHGEAGAETEPQVPRELRDLSAAEIAKLRVLYRHIQAGRKVDIHVVEGVVRNLITGFRRDVGPLALLSALKLQDSYTFAHVVNVAILTMAQAASIGFGGEALHRIGVAAVLHDVGKMFIPLEILNKPGKLTDEERTVMEGHAAKGASYLLGIEGTPRLAIVTALEHHLKYDGTGYPRLAGHWRPSFVSQMISVADVYDALRTRRPYRDPMPEDRIIKILNGDSGTAFDPRLVANFLKLIEN